MKQDDSKKIAGLPRNIFFAGIVSFFMVWGPCRRGSYPTALDPSRSFFWGLFSLEPSILVFPRPADLPIPGRFLSSVGLLRTRQEISCTIPLISPFMLSLSKHCRIVHPSTSSGRTVVGPLCQGYLFTDPKKLALRNDPCSVLSRHRRMRELRGEDPPSSGFVDPRRGPVGFV